MARSTARDFLTLGGSSRTLGGALGTACSAVLRKRVRATRRVQKEHHIPEAIVSARVRDFVRLVRKVAPHWLSEASAMAEAARVKFDDILMLNCLPPGFFEPPQSCTSFVSIGETHSMVFKIRDNCPVVQQFFVSTARGKPRYQAARDIGNLGIAHAFSEHGLAGGNDTGSHTDRVPDDVRFDDCHVLRYFVENATSVADVPRCYERLMELGAGGGAGPGRGAIYVMADPDQGLILETVADDMAVEFVGSGTRVISNHFLSAKARAWESKPADKNTLLRFQRMEELLGRCEGPVAPLEVFAFSRDRKSLPHSLCNDDRAHYWMTVSAQLQVIDRKQPERSVNYVCCGNTRHSVYAPWPLTATESYRPLLDGSFYKRTDALYRREPCSTHLAQAQRTFERAALTAANHAALCREAFALVRSA